MVVTAAVVFGQWRFAFRAAKAASEGLDSSNAAVTAAPSQRAPAGSSSGGRQRTAAASSSGGGGGAVLVGQQLCCRRAAAAQPLDSSGDQLQILAAATSSSICTTSNSRAYRRLVDSGSPDFGWGSSHGVPGNGGRRLLQWERAGGCVNEGSSGGSSLGCGWRPKP
ncbi:hypothetical protein SASPL_105674 [Salvia splendens]|uniref:Uncharacterized protein n=1 Tax=Salvia splendens TaxID=180675 RepID=A0A8X9AA73_SALSN|nr:hypothetical protein SASPL_105674 [Salvia splendens]